MMKTNQKGINLIKSFEGFRAKAYKALPSEKYYTIGFGHYGADVKAGMVISIETAEKLLKQDLERFETAVEKLNLDLTENEFSALVSFTYNCGEANLKKLVKGRSISEIGQALLLYNKAGGKTLEGLARRRRAEKDLFFTPVAGGNIKNKRSVALQKFLNEQLGGGLVLDGIVGNKTRGQLELFLNSIGVYIKWV